MRKTKSVLGFVFEPDRHEAFCDPRADAARRGSQTGCIKCVKSGRPVILTTVFADCGRFSKCVFIHLREYFWCTEILVQIFKDTCFCVFVIDWALFPLNRSVSVRFGTDTPSHTRTTVISRLFLFRHTRTTLDDDDDVVLHTISSHPFIYIL